MADNYRVAYSVNGPAGSLSGVMTIPAGAGASLNEEIPANQTNKEVIWPIDKSQAKILLIVPTMDVTIKTNSTSEPGETIEIAAGGAYFWNLGIPYDNPLAGDVAKFYVTNTAAGVIKGILAYDPTP